MACGWCSVSGVMMPELLGWLKGPSMAAEEACEGVRDMRFKPFTCEIRG